MEKASMCDTSSSSGKPIKERTRTGCITCRIRRVKCDESKPWCNRCTRSRRTCDGYAPPHAADLSRRALTCAIRGLTTVRPASPVLAGLRAADDVACFDVFRHLTVYSAGGFSPRSDDFWSQKVLQVAQAEPAVFLATVALGALHRHLQLQFTPGKYGSVSADCSSFSEKALGCYYRSLALAQSIRDPVTLLVLSILLLGISNLSGKWLDGHIHISSAKRLLAEIQRTTTSYRTIVESAAGCLARMDLQAATFSESSAPYLLGSDGDALNPANICQSRAKQLESLGQATMGVFNLLRTLLQLDNLLIDESPSSRPHEHIISAVTEETTAWEAHLSTYLTRVPATDQAHLLLPKLYHSTISLLLRVKFAGSELRYDTCLPYFERIISLAASLLRPTKPCDTPVLSLEPGVIAPLYLTATRCRHPAVRRHALALLQLANRQEGMWPSNGAAAVARNIIIVEEEDLGIQVPPSRSPLRVVDLGRLASRIAHEVNGDWLSTNRYWRSDSSWEGVPVVPEGRRVVDSIFVANVDERKVEMTLVLSGKKEDGSSSTQCIVVGF